MPLSAKAHDSTFRSTRKTKTMPTQTVRAEKLRASQLVNVAAEELEWFFTSTDSEGPALRARIVIENCLATLDEATQRTLALRFDPTPWPETMQAEGLASGYALAVQLATPVKWTDRSSVHQEHHRHAGDQLEAAVLERGITVLRGIRRRADWDFASAVRAYANARGRAPSVVPRHAA